MTTEITYSVERDGEEIELTISGYCTKYVSARTSGRPENCSPAEGGDAEIEEIFCGSEPWDGELTGTEQEEIEQSLYEGAVQDTSSAEEDAAAERYEAQRKRWD